jgi:hypothetical protein
VLCKAAEAAAATTEKRKHTTMATARDLTVMTFIGVGVQQLVGKPRSNADTRSVRSRYTIQKGQDTCDQEAQIQGGQLEAGVVFEPCRLRWPPDAVLLEDFMRAERRLVSQ